MSCRFGTTDYVALKSRESNKSQMQWKGRGVEQGQKSLLGWIPHFPQIPEGPAWEHIAFSAPILWQESAWEYKFQKDGVEHPGASPGTKNNCDAWSSSLFAHYIGFYIVQMFWEYLSAKALCALKWKGFG